MRLLILAAAALSVATPALAQTAASPAPAHAAHAKLNTTDTELGVLLDNRAMTLKSIQQYAPDDVTDARLAAIDADLAKLP